MRAKAFFVSASMNIDFCWPQRRIGNRKNLIGVAYFVWEKHHTELLYMLLKIYDANGDTNNISQLLQEY